MDYVLKTDRMALGTCYYPEHWDESLWEDDLKRMLEYGVETIRIAEFAWSKIEPREGEFTYDFFDRFLEKVAGTRMKVIFCTPTATPPAWLTEKYPEVLNANIDGVLYRHGCRRHYNYNSPIYQELSRRIVEKSAAHYASHPSVIGWQIDNEINCEKDEFYSESDTIAFRMFLKEKYNTLDRLNDVWGTVFWNQTYTQWEEIHVPRTTPSNSTNPHEVMDYIRFVSDSACRFVKLQSDILRKYIKPGDYITTNGLFGKLDSHRMTEESLDFLMYDSYPNFAYGNESYERDSKTLGDRKWSRNLAQIRSISPVFGIMEQQSGANGWNTRMQAPTPKPGQMALWTMQSMAHGADYVSYFRWRTAAMGTEIYWHGILDYSNRDNRRLKELSQINEMVKKLAPVTGARYEAKVGVIRDYDNTWDADLDAWHCDVEAVSQYGIFAACQLTHTPYDYCYLDHCDESSLAGYRLLFLPHATIVTPEYARRLEAYVEQGGCLVMGCRTGYKDETGKCPMHRLPGLLQKLAGTDVLEYSGVSPEDGHIYVQWGEDRIEAAVFNDLLAPLGDEAVIEGEYLSSYFAGTPALIHNRFGKGHVYYFGGAFTDETARVFLRRLGETEPYRDLIELPEGCELAVRVKDGVKYLFVLNYLNEVQTIELKKEMTDLFAENRTVGTVALKAYEVKVYQQG